MTIVIDAITMVDSAVVDYTQFCEKSFEVLTSLQEDRNLQRPKTEACEMQQRDDEVKGTRKPSRSQKY